MGAVQVGSTTVEFTDHLLSGSPRGRYALVSSDDTWLSAGGGVSAAVLKAAGAEVRSEMIDLVREAGGRLPLATTHRTSGGASGAALILHAVTLDPESGRATRFELLSSLILAVLDRAAWEGVTCVVMPALATGAAGATREEFLEAFRAAIREHARAPGALERVIVALQGGEPDAVWTTALADRRPPPGAWSVLAHGVSPILAQVLQTLDGLAPESALSMLVSAIRETAAREDLSAWLDAAAEAIHAQPALARVAQAIGGLQPLLSGTMPVGAAGMQALRDCFILLQLGFTATDKSLSGASDGAFSAQAASLASVSLAGITTYGKVWASRRWTTTVSDVAAAASALWRHQDQGSETLAKTTHPAPVAALGDEERAPAPLPGPSEDAKTAPSRLADLVIECADPSEVAFLTEALRGQGYRGSDRQVLTEYAINDSPQRLLDYIRPARRVAIARERAGMAPSTPPTSEAIPNAILEALGFRLPAPLLGPRTILGRIRELARLASQDRSTAPDRVREAGGLLERLLKQTIVCRAQLDFASEASTLLQSRRWLSSTQTLESLGLGALLAVCAKLDDARPKPTSRRLLPGGMTKLAMIRNEYVHDRDYRRWTPPEFFEDALRLVDHLCEGNPPLTLPLARVVEHRVDGWGVHTYTLQPESGHDTHAHVDEDLVVGAVYHFYATSNPKAVFPTLVRSPR